MKINSNYANLKESYLFSDIGARVKKFKEENPEAQVIRLGIGDVTLPLAPCVIEAMGKATAEMGDKAHFRGYGEDQGYSFLRDAVCGYYAKKGVILDNDEVFISDGAKSDLGNILDIFSSDNTVLIPDPVYPVYVDTNIMAGRKIIYASANEENGFLPLPDKSVHCDIIYICSPNNPTGAAYDKPSLQKWVDYANEIGAVILYDAAYEAFIDDSEIPSSIYQLDNARECAIELCSLSKTAGFTGTRCGYTVVPKALLRDNTSLNRMWLRRQTTKFNEVAYVVQRAAEAVFTPTGLAETKANINYYKENAAIIAATLEKMGVWFCGGKHSPYIWLKCIDGMSSWEFFDFLLTKAKVVGTPGAGFGKNGEGYFRLSAFGSREDILKAMPAIEKAVEGR